jgi:exosortase
MSTTTVPYAPQPPTKQATGSYTRSSVVILSVVAVELLILYAPTLRWLFDRWTMSVWHNAHGLFVFPVAAWLIWQELRTTPMTPVTSSAWGFALLVPALALHALDSGMHTQLLSALSLIMVLPGLSLLLIGIDRTLAIAFPLLFTVFAIPIPLVLTESAHLFLRQVAVSSTAFVLPLLGIPAFIEGTTIHTSSGSLVVADACSGFSTLYAAAAVACLTAYTASSNVRRLIVMLAFTPIAIGSNVLRVVLLVALVTWRGQTVLETPLHPLSGMLTFAITLPLIFWLGGPVSAAAPVDAREPSPAMDRRVDGGASHGVEGADRS